MGDILALQTMPFPLSLVSPAPLEFMLKATQQHSTEFAAVVNRSAARLGRQTFDVFENDSGVGRKLMASIPLKANPNNHPAITALQYCAVNLMSPGIAADEARRVATGQPRGLDGVEPELDEVRLPNQREAALFGFDDAAFIAIVTALLPILIALVAAILPALIELVSNLAPTFFGGGPDSNGNIEVATTAPRAIFEDPIVLGALALVAFLVLR
jgi:hypothetical protein